MRVKLDRPFRFSPIPPFFRVFPFYRDRFLPPVSLKLVIPIAPNVDVGPTDVLFFEKQIKNQYFNGIFPFFEIARLQFIAFRRRAPMNRPFRIVGPPIANSQRFPRDSRRSGGQNGRFPSRPADRRVPTVGQNADFRKDENFVRRVETFRTPEKSARESSRRRQRRKPTNAAPRDDAAIPFATPFAPFHSRKISDRSGRRGDVRPRFVLPYLLICRVLPIFPLPASFPFLVLRAFVRFLPLRRR